MCCNLRQRGVVRYHMRWQAAVGACGGEAQRPGLWYPDERTLHRCCRSALRQPVWRRGFQRGGVRHDQRQRSMRRAWPLHPFWFWIAVFDRIIKFAGGATRGGAGARILGRGWHTIVGAFAIPSAGPCAAVVGSILCQRLGAENWLVMFVLEPTVANRKSIQFNSVGMLQSE